MADTLSTDWRQADFIREPEVGDILYFQASTFPTYSKILEITGINSFGPFVREFPHGPNGQGHSHLHWSHCRNYELFSRKEWKERTGQ